MGIKAHADQVAAVDRREIDMSVAHAILPQRADHLIADLVAIAADGGADCGADILGLTSKLIAHRNDGSPRDIGGRAPPTCVNRADDALYRIGDENGHAVSGTHKTNDAGFCGDKGITYNHTVVLSSIEYMHRIPMHLMRPMDDHAIRDMLFNRHTGSPKAMLNTADAT